MIGGMLALAALVAGGPERQNDLLHADLPLFGDATADKEPRSFTDPASGSFGCATRVRFGDWQMTEGGERESSWLRILNYGAIHCWAEVASAPTPAALEHADSRPAFLVPLGREGGRELWALQLGARPGSEYVLLSRPSGNAVITTFTVLQRACPKGWSREGEPLDILITRYCHVSTADDLRDLSRRMSHLPPLGTLKWVKAAPREP